VARAYAAGRRGGAVRAHRPEYFGGDLEALERSGGGGAPGAAQGLHDRPVQLWEARAAGADAVLLIVRILDPAALAELHGLAAELGMDVLVEAHTRGRAGRALAAGAALVGVNNRDLDTFATDVSFCLAQAPHRPRT
jgi:indole-3-glycerol phosphate synthase